MYTMYINIYSIVCNILMKVLIFLRSEYSELFFKKYILLLFIVSLMRNRRSSAFAAAAALAFFFYVSVLRPKKTYFLDEIEISIEKEENPHLKDKLEEFSRKWQGENGVSDSNFNVNF